MTIGGITALDLGRAVSIDKSANPAQLICMLTSHHNAGTIEMMI